MIHGLFLDPRAWNIDFTPSPFWNTEKYGIKIDLHPDAFHIPKMGVDKKYKFVIATEVWEIPIRKALQYLRDKGLKVFLIAREPVKYGEAINGMFSYERFFFNNEYYFKPDAVFGAGQKFADIWEGKTETYVTGYPRWDLYADKKLWKSREEIFKTYGLEQDRKMIFFPSYPPYAYKKENGKDTFVDLSETRDSVFEAVSDFARENPEYQFVSKIHPMSMKCYRKKTGMRNEVSGLLEKYYKSPTKYFKVIGDERMSGNIAKDLLIGSDLMIGFYSTMLLESIMLRKPAVQALIGERAVMFDNPYEGMFPTVFTKAELKSFLKEYSSDSYSPSFADDRMVEYTHHIDKKACERICDAIKKEMAK